MVTFFWDSLGLNAILVSLATLLLTFYLSQGFGIGQQTTPGRSPLKKMGYCSWVFDCLMIKGHPQRMVDLFQRRVYQHRRELFGQRVRRIQKSRRLRKNEFFVP